jgi:hypothetical protein
MRFTSFLASSFVLACASHAVAAYHPTGTRKHGHHEELCARLDAKLEVDLHWEKIVVGDLGASQFPLSIHDH